MIKKVFSIINELGNMVLFVKEIFHTLMVRPCTYHSVAEQTWRVTVQSFPTTLLAGFFVGGIMTVQFTLLAKEFGALGFLGGLSTSATVRELGPLLIAFLLSGKVGAFTSAELGTMKVTEQIDAIRCLGADPIQEIILPRFIGIMISSFFLLMVGLLMSVFGGLLMALFFSGITMEEYFRHIPSIVKFPSIISGMFKAIVFAFVLSSICTYKGYTTTGGAKGVGRSVINTAVATMIGLVIADWLTSVFGDTVTKFIIESKFW